MARWISPRLWDAASPMLSPLDRQVFAVRARARLFRGKPAGPRIAIVGNCQGAGVAYGLSLLIPEAGIDFYEVHPRTLTSVDRLAAILKSYDLAFCGDFPRGFLRGGDADALRERLPALGRFPVIAFAGFHPDLIALQRTPGRPRNVIGPMGPYHSAIVLFAYRAGLSADQAEALFDGLAFQLLGYFETWDPACAALLDYGRSMGIDLSRDLIRWTRRGCFMHTVNHPKPHVLFDIARIILARAGIAAPDIEFDDFVRDPLAAGQVWPVYGPIAESLGLKGSYLFKQADAGRRRGGFLGLRQFIAGSYKTYGRRPRRELEHPRVSGLLDHADTVRTLCDLARTKRKRNGGA